MPANVWSSEEEEELFSYAGKLARLRLVRNYLNHSYDYIIIDCPPFVSNITVGALAASDSILIPLQCGFLSLKAMNRLMKVIRKIQDGMNKGLKIEGILLTMYEQGTNISQRTEDEARLVFKEVVFDIKIPKNVKLGEAIFHGLPAILYDARSAGSKAYLELARELLKKKKKR
jgi:chromosome partitioning protein